MSTRGWEHATPTDVRHRRPLATMPHKARSKYGAVKTTVDNLTFDSAKEAKRYGELKLLEKAGKIARLTLQQRFELCVPQTDLGGKQIDPAGWWRVIGHYVSDFTYDELSPEATRFVVEDVKGFKTQMYRWKKKHVEAQYGFKITEL